MTTPGFSVIPDYLVQYSSAVEAVAQAVSDAASTAHNNGFGGIPVFGLLASPWALPWVHSAGNSTSDSIQAAADLGQRVVASLKSTADQYSTAESALLTSLIQMKAQVVDDAAAGLTAKPNRPLYSDSGGVVDDSVQFGTDIAALVNGNGSIGTDIGNVAVDAAGEALDVIGVVYDIPGSLWGALWSLGIGWVIEQVPIFRVPVDDLLGDPDAIKAVAGTWADLAGWLSAMPDELLGALPMIASWQGTAADQYRLLEQQFEMVFAPLHDECLSVAKNIMYIGAIVAQVRAVCLNMISDLVQWAVATWVAALGLSECTFGASLGSAGLAMSIESEVTGTKLLLAIGQLGVKIGQAALSAQALHETADMVTSTLHQAVTKSTISV